MHVSEHLIICNLYRLQRYCILAHHAQKKVRLSDTMRCEATRL